MQNKANQPLGDSTMSKTFKDSRTTRNLVKTDKPSKAPIQAYKRKRTKEIYRLDPTWKSGLEHRLGADD
jgi:hypothetical protein